MKELTKRQKVILDFIKSYMVSHGYPPTIREIGDAVGNSSPATVHAHLANLEKAGYIKKQDSKNRALELLVENEYIEKDEKVASVPLLGKVQAGNPIEAIEMPNEFFSLPIDLIPRGKEVFTLRVSGESMINVGIYDGDIIIIQRQETANNGDTIVAMTEDYGVTVKTFYKEKDHIRLQPENDYMEPIILQNCTILGKVVGLYRKL